MEQEYLNASELAMKFRVSIATVYYWLQVGKLSATKVGRQLLFNKKVVNEFAARHTVSKNDQ